MMPYVFYFLSAITLLCALLVVTANNPIHSVIYLVLTFFGVAGHYVLLNAQFLAIVNIIVYAGAIMVLFLFVLMLLNLNSDTEPQKSNLIKVIGAITGGSLLLLIVAAIRKAGLPTVPLESNEIGLIKNLGLTLFKDFVVPFELSSILFLSAMIGAVLIGKKED
jgi:NADH-quinone oxidoreductase subunit J